MTNSPEPTNLFAVSSLPIRYQISASVVNTRRNFLKIPSIREGKVFYITNEDLTRLDKLHGFILSGGKLKDYVEEVATTPPATPQPLSRETPQDKPTPPPPVETAVTEDTQQPETETETETEPETEPETEEKEDQEEEPKALFQAIGTLKGTVTVTEPALFKISLVGIEFRVYIPTAQMRYNFRQQLKKNNNLYIRVYPRTFITPDRQSELYFQLVAWSEELQNDAEGIKQEAGIFKLKGVWQFVPQFRAPILTIYRNRKCQFDPTKKFKANHLPILMRREDCTPFRFNPKADKDSIPPRYFVNGIFKFIPQKNAFGWQNDIEPPTTDLPRYRKPTKVVAATPPAEGKQGKKIDYKPKSDYQAKPENVVKSEDQPKPTTISKPEKPVKKK